MSNEEVEELRSVTRFVIDPPLRGAFSNVDISIDDFGERGVQAEHAGPIKLGHVSRLSFTIPMSQEVVRIQARVAWSRLSKKPDPQGKYLYRSGLRVEGDPEVMKSTLARLVNVCAARPDNASLERKRKALVERARARAQATTMKPILHRGAGDSAGPRPADPAGPEPPAGHARGGGEVVQPGEVLAGHHG